MWLPSRAWWSRSCGSCKDTAPRKHRSASSVGLGQGLLGWMLGAEKGATAASPSALPLLFIWGPHSQSSHLSPVSPESVSQLPLFGYTVYVVLRVSGMTLPGSGLLGLNRQHLVLMDPSSQVGLGGLGLFPSHHLQ